MLCLTEIHRKKLDSKFLEVIDEFNKNKSLLESKRVASIAINHILSEDNPKHLHHLYDVYRYSQLNRFLSLLNGVSDAWNSGNVLVSNIISRSIMESIASLHYFIKKLTAYADAKDYDNAYYWIMRSALSTKGEGIEKPDIYRDVNLKPIHILDAIRETKKTYEPFYDEYEWLSEFTHPNCLGTMASYMRFSPERDRVLFADGEWIESHTLSNCLGALVFVAIFIDDWEKSGILSKRLIEMDWSATEQFYDFFEGGRNCANSNKNTG